MIEFQDPTDDRESLVAKIRNQIQLIRALANFHVESASLDSEEMENQRQQLVRSAKELGLIFENLVALLKESQEIITPEPEEPEKSSNHDWVSEFVTKTVPEEMRTRWDPQRFTGSLLVFFEQGKIDSASLIEKKASPERGAVSDDLTDNLLGNESEEQDRVKVVANQEDSFTVLKSPEDSNIHFYFSLREASSVALRIYNQMDQMVREINKFYDRAGDYIIVWDGLDDEGNPLPKERYSCQLQAGDYQYEPKSIDLS